MTKIAQALVGARNSHVRFGILALVVLLATVAYADRSILSVAGPGIKAEFGLSNIQLGYILSAFSWAYVLGQVPGGIMLDRLGTKKMYGAILVLWSLATFVLGFVGELTRGTTGAVVALFVLRFALGLIEAPSYPANARVTVMWMPKAERGRATSLFASSQYFAVAIFSPLAAWLVSEFGWPWPFFVLGVVGFVSAIAWMVYMDEPRQHPGVSPAELEYIIEGGALIDVDSPAARVRKPGATVAMFKLLLTNRMLWCTYLGQYCTIALSYFFITWFPIYLVQARHMDVLHAGFATIAPSLFGFAGGIAGGTISDHLIKMGVSLSWARKGPYIGGMLMASTLIIAGMSNSNLVVVAMMSFAFFGKALAAGAGTWAVVSDTAPKAAIGLAGSIFNCIGNIAGIVTPIVFGYIIDLTGDYGLGLMFVGLHCILAALVFLLVMGKIERVGGEDAVAA